MSQQNRVFFFIAAICISIGSLALPVNAQFKRVPIVDAVRNPRPIVRTAPVRRIVSVRRVDTKVITRTERVRVNNLTVSTEKGAKVTLELKAPKPVTIEKIADAKGSAIFEDLKPGVYKVLASKDDFETAEADKVTISAQKAHGLAMDLKAVTYNLKIQTNLTGGEILFAQAIQKGKDASGAIISEQLGNYCVVKVQPNGEAVITELKKGYYDIDIRPEALEFDKRETGINIPEDIDQVDGNTTGELKTFQIDLEKKLSTEAFTTSWITADWEMPAAWRLEKGLKVRSDGIGLPRNERYRNYVNFEMIANVKLPDESTAGFVLRAEDFKNYYLLQISGSRAQNPNTATLSSVKNGTMQFINSATTVAFAKTLSADSGFRILVKGDQAGFTIWIEDSTTGKTHAVGQLKDPYKTYQKGAIGIAGILKSNFEVNYFEVCTPACSK